MSANQRTRRTTTCTGGRLAAFTQVDGQLSVPRDVQRSSNLESAHPTDVVVKDSMQLNPYEPNQRVVDKALGNSRFALAHRVGFVGLLSALFAFGIGVVWIKLLRRNPTEVSPVSWTLAQSVAYGGMAIVLIGLVSLVRSRVSRLSERLANEQTTVFGWNFVPVVLSSLIGAAWFGLACLGLYSLVGELVNYDFYRGLPVLEIVLQFLLYCSGLAATGCCLKANRQWMRKNSGRAFLYTAAGFFGPLLAYVMLFRVCEELVRYLV